MLHLHAELRDASDGHKGMHATVEFLGKITDAHGSTRASGSPLITVRAIVNGSTVSVLRHFPRVTGDPGTPGTPGRIANANEDVRRLAESVKAWGESVSESFGYDPGEAFLGMAATRNWEDEQGK